MSSHDLLDPPPPPPLRKCLKFAQWNNCLTNKKNQHYIRRYQRVLFQTLHVPLQLLLLPEVAKIPPTMPHRRTRKPQNDRRRFSTRTMMDDKSYLKKIPKNQKTKWKKNNEVFEMDSFQKWEQATTCIGGCTTRILKDGIYRRGADVTKHYCAFQKCELWSLKVAFTIAFFTAVNHNYDHKQRTLKHRNTQNGSKSTNHKSQRNLRFKPAEVNYSLLRGPLRWLMTAKNANVS